MSLVVCVLALPGYNRVWLIIIDYVVYCIKLPAVHAGICSFTSLHSCSVSSIELASGDLFGV